MKRRKITTLILLTILASCKATSRSLDEAQTTSNQANNFENTITAKPLQLEQIEITIDELSEPYTTKSASASPQVIAIPDNPTLNVPNGFKVNVFAENLDRPRWLNLTPDGDGLVTQSKANKITLLQDRDRDGVAESSRVVVSPDGQKLDVSIGSRSNASREPLPRASVQVMDLDGSNRETFAYGWRNLVGLDFHPQTKELYVTVNEGDKPSDELVPDYFTKLEKAEFYGCPYAYLTPDLLDLRYLQQGIRTFRLETTSRILSRLCYGFFDRTKRSYYLGSSCRVTHIARR